MKDMSYFSQEQRYFISVLAYHAVRGRSVSECYNRALAETLEAWNLKRDEFDPPREETKSRINYRGQTVTYYYAWPRHELYPEIS